MSQHASFESPNCPSPAGAPGGLIQALAMSLQVRDGYTRQHCDRVGQLAHALARHCGVSAIECDQIALAACMHDIGKIGTPDAILRSPNQHTADEQAIMREHPVHGERIFLATGRDDAIAVAQVIRAHHEAFDGSGYPDGLAGEHIPLGARIVTVADAFDAMFSDRPYRPAMEQSQVLRILDDAAGGLVDPYVLRRFMAMLRRWPVV